MLLLGVEYYSEAPEPQTNKRKRILNVQSSVLSKFGVEIPQEKKLILLATLQVLQKAIAIAFYCVCIHLL